MNARQVRLAAILGQALACLGIFTFGIAEGVLFFSTFIGPAALLVLVAFFPRFYYDLAALAVMVLLLFIALLYSATAALFNHEFLRAALALAIPAAGLTGLIYSMERLKREDPDYA